MTSRKPRKRAERAPQAAPDLNPFPGITGPGAEPHTSPGEPSKGLFGDGMDGTLGDVSERQREQLGRERAAAERAQRDQHAMTSGTSISPLSDSFDARADPPTRQPGGQGATGGGVAVSQGRGSDVGAFKRGMARDPGVEPISGGGSGGSRAGDLGMGARADLDAQPNDRQGLSADERVTGDRGRDTP